MTIQSTPGPWHLDASTGPIRVIASTTIIAEVAQHTGGIGLANGTVLAAAKDLLDVLLLALPFVEDAENDPGYQPGYAAWTAKQIRAAISKATLE